MNEQMRAEESIQSVTELISQQIKLLNHLSNDLWAYEHVIANEDELSHQLPAIQSLLSEVNESLQGKIMTFRSTCQRKTATKTFIHRLPNELLRNILVFVIFAKGAHERLPLKLMRTCRLWNSLISDIEWPRFTISFTWPRASIKAAWHFLSQRLKHTPRRLIVDDIPGSDKKSFGLVNLNNLPPLHALEIRVNDWLREAASLAFACTCPELIVVGVGDEGEEEEDTLELAPILAPFTGVTKVFVTNYRPKISTWNRWQYSPQWFAGIKIFSIRNVDGGEVSLDSLVNYMPSLEVLAVTDCELYIEGYDKRTLLSNSLMTLKIRGMRPLWMDKFQAPNLIHLSLDEVGALEHTYTEEEAALRTFLSSTSGLKYLDIYKSYTPQTINDSNNLFTLALCCPKLETLSLSELIHRFPQQEFPHLKTLDVRYLASFRVESYESLVRARCLPKAHALATMDPSLALHPLDLIFDKGDCPQIEEAIQSAASFQGATLEARDWVDPFGMKQSGIVLKWT